MVSLSPAPPASGLALRAAELARIDGGTGVGHRYRDVDRAEVPTCWAAAGVDLSPGAWIRILCGPSHASRIVDASVWSGGVDLTAAEAEGQLAGHGKCRSRFPLGARRRPGLFCLR